MAERTGIAAGTIRMWEQRYGFPEPERTSAGYRLYSEGDVDALRRVLALRESGLSVPAAVERARDTDTDTATDRPSLYGALAGGDLPVRSQVLSKRTLLAISRAIEDETMASAAAPVMFGAFHREHNYRAVEHRYRAISRTADAVVVFDAPGYSACLVAWEQPRAAARGGADQDRTFEAIWTLDPRVVRRASEVGAGLARRADDALGDRVDALLMDRPLAIEQPAPS